MQPPQVASPDSAYRPPKPRRILACVLCQQRKIKCNRKVPCNHCTKAELRCVPAQQKPRRRKKPSKQDLTEKLQQYEALLRKNNISTDTPGDVDTEDWIADGGAVPESSGSQRYLDGLTDDVQREQQMVDTLKNSRDTMHQTVPDSQHTSERTDFDNNSGYPSLNVASESVIAKAWKRVYESDHNYLFGYTMIDMPLSSLHPSQARRSKLWQVYSDNVNPLIKVTHAPTLQASLLDAAADLKGISHELEALMFSIYCAALITMSEDECCALLGEPKARLLSKYQDACRQALINCTFLRSRERNCLTAYFLYLISIRPGVHPHILSPMFAIAFRIAYRMNICNEAANAVHGVFEAEMRRRLWWAMVVYDSRLSEITDYKTTQLLPTWDCKIPANLNDFDLRPKMIASPAEQDASTEALFVVVQGTIGNFVRHNAWHLNFINPMLRHIAKVKQHPFDSNESNLRDFERIIEDRFLRHCNPENPLHHITIWWSRNYVARYRFFLHCSQHSQSSDNQPTEQYDNILSYALRVIECDTALAASPLTKKYRSIIQLHFPFQAYMRIMKDLQSRPAHPLANKAWGVMSANYTVHFMDMESSANIPFKMFASAALQAWAARQVALSDQNDIEEAGMMISDIRRRLGRSSSPIANAHGTVAPVPTDMTMLT